VFKYDRIKEAVRQAQGQDHCTSKGQVFELSSLFVGGLIYDPTSPATPLTVGVSVGKRTGALIYAVNEDFEIHVGFDGIRGTPNAVKHETLFHNADVRAAGEMEIEVGVIIEVGDVSGTYGTPGMIQTDPLFADAVLTALDRINAPLADNERRRLERRAGKR
jgi:hypothetical protein